eukprot:m.134453 g.134453  ORF g.134453 m.134453 type:complete len:1710 (+) comp29740_c0_seq1:166-5295(+)
MPISIPKVTLSLSGCLSLVFTFESIMSATSIEFEGEKIQLTFDDVFSYNTNGGNTILSTTEFDGPLRPTPYTSNETYELQLGRGDWHVLQDEPAFTYAPTERDVSLTYHIEFSTLHHIENSHHNEPQGVASEMVYRLALVRKQDVLPTVGEISSITSTCAYNSTLNRVPAFTEAGCNVLEMFHDENEIITSSDAHEMTIVPGPGSASNVDWHKVEINFTVQDRCDDCVLKLVVRQADWISYWGSIMYVANITIERFSVDIPERRFTDGVHERVVIPKPSRIIDATLASDCPYLELGLKLWHDAATWSTGEIPNISDETITLPSNTKVLVTSVSFISTESSPYRIIVVPSTSELIFADESITLHVKEMRVMGKFRVGAAACRVQGPILIGFHGDKDDNYTKGLRVIGGVAEVFGQLHQPSWTRLSSTAFAADSIINVQDVIGGIDGWKIGMQVVIVTGVYEDRAGYFPQNEIRTITSIASDGLSFGVDSALMFRHHGGVEYQSEVALLDRSIQFKGVLTAQNMADGYGGHIIVENGGVGKFSSTKARHMGQQNLIGRYPYHFHMLDVTYPTIGTVVAEVGGVECDLIGTGWTKYVTSIDHEHLLYGDGSMWHTNQPDTSAVFSHTVTRAGVYEILFSKPPDLTEVHGFSSWNGVHLSRNITLTVTQQGIVLQEVSLDFRESDPVDTLKKWNLATLVDLEAGAVNVSLTMSDNYAQLDVFALAAIWVREDRSKLNYVENSVITESFYRCITIHGTNNVRLSSNVAYDIRGHCYYLEDGVEERNTIEYNLASFIHPIGSAAAGGAQVGTVFYEDDEVRQPADHAAAGYYITNARNYFYGNAASGGWTGFSFPNLPLPVGNHHGLDFKWFNPMQRKELTFDGNSAHSAGQDWINGMCMYVGGRLTVQESGLLRYHTGRNTRQTLDVNHQSSYNEFSNLLVFLCRRGVNHWGSDVDIVNYEAIDVAQGAVLFGQAYLKHALIQAQSSNIASTITSHLGFQFYDTWTKTMLDDVIFRSFKFVDQGIEEHTERAGYTNRVIDPMDHSDTFKPQGISAVRNITFEDTDERAIFDFAGVDTGAGYMYNHISVDGTLAGRTNYSIVGSKTTWWNLGEQCELHPVWNTWVCEASPEGTVASLDVSFDGFTREDWEFSTIESHRHIGYVCQQSVEDVGSGKLPNQDKTLSECMIITKNPTTTGVANRVWFWYFFGAGVAKYGTDGLLAWDAAPASFQINNVQISRNQFVIIAIPYPRTMDLSDFNVHLFAPYHGADEIAIPHADSLAHILTPTEKVKDNIDYVVDCATLLCNVSNVGPLFFWDQAAGMMYLRVIDARYYLQRFLRNGQTSIQDYSFKRDGMSLNSINNLVYHRVRVNCIDDDALNSKACIVKQNMLPAAARPSGDSCQVATPWRILPARLDITNTLVFAWQVPNAQGPAFDDGPFKIQRGAVLSLSMSNGFDVIQLFDQNRFDGCDTLDSVSLHSYSSDGPSFDITLSSIGHYFFASTASCNSGVKLHVIVLDDVVAGATPTNTAPPINNVDGFRLPTHMTCGSWAHCGFNNSTTGTFQLTFRQTADTDNDTASWNWQNHNAHNDTHQQYSSLDQLEDYRLDSGEFVFELSWPSNSHESRTIVWSQTSNPIETHAVTNFTLLEDTTNSLVPFTGLAMSTSQFAFLDGNVGQRWWYYAIGVNRLWPDHMGGKGIPAFNRVAAISVELRVLNC